MLSSPRMHNVLAAALWAAAFCVSTATAHAQDLPVVSYSAKEGLPHDTTNRLFLDSQGFLWIGGPTALARFDGERFTSYSRAAGLDVGTGVNDLRAGRRGDLWIATNGSGLYRLDLAARERAARFTQMLVGEGRAANRVNVFLLLADDTLLAGTDAGLFIRGADQSFTRVLLPVPRGLPQDSVQITSLVPGTSWIVVGTSRGVYRCVPGAQMTCASAAAVNVRSMVRGYDGRLWMGGLDGVHVAADTDGILQPTVVNMGGPWKVRRVAAVGDGVVVGTEDGRVILLGTAGPRTLYAAADSCRINDIAEDVAGNLWIATSDGMVTVRRQGVTVIGTSHGLRQPYVRSLRRDRSGRVYVLSEDEWVHRFDGLRLPGARLAVPSGFQRSLWAGSSFQVGADGSIWLGTANGLFRYEAATFSSDHWIELQPVASYTTRDGLAGNHIADIYEDSRGDRWISSMPAGSGDTLSVWRKATSRFERLGVEQGLPPFNQPSGFVEDRHGAIWAVLREGGVLRVRNGRATVFGADRGFPPLSTTLFVDSAGRLWVGGVDEVFRVDDTGADSVEATSVLSRIGTHVRSLVQDGSGTVFIGTYEGLLALDPASGGVRRFSTFEGLPRGNIDSLAAAQDGSLLLRAGRTLARLAPSRHVSDDLPPRCLFSNVAVGGRPIPLPESGLERVESVDVLPSQNTVDIEFVGLSPRLGEPLTYEYRLDGVSQQWTRAIQRRVTYAGLAPGRYTFEVRAAAASRTAVSAPATVAFTVLPPWYRSWWFLAIVASAAAAAGYAGHRARLARALHTERLRSRIATDLHDDIGSSLSQIAILAEVARRRAGVAAPGVAEPLASIATTSRDLVDAMSDIVWAVNPRTDTLGDLTRRMHRFAAEILGGADIELTFSAPPSDVDMKLGADLRRELYLILKESVNNIARHSGATQATVDLTLARHELTLTISDNGRGFDPGVSVDGNGIASMRKRAATFGGDFTIDSGPGQGTRVSLRANPRRLP
jgi:signal transduction histidine kinase/ligand-binding sensor domain-containing protein